jgi:uncharacterized protein
MRRSLLVGVAVLSGCLGPRQDTSAFFVLSPAPAPTAGTPLPISIGLGPITLPGYLDRPQIVVRLDDNQLALSDSDRWAEPLSDNVTRTLEANLAALLPGSTYVHYPWYASAAPDYAVALEVRRFEADAAGAVVLDATWRLSRGGSVVDRQVARLEEAAGGPERVAAVAAQSRALGQLSAQIAAVVRRAAGRSPN